MARALWSLAAGRGELPGQISESFALGLQCRHGHGPFVPGGVEFVAELPSPLGGVGFLVSAVPQFPDIVKQDLDDGRAPVAVVGPIVVVAAHDPVEYPRLQRRQVEHQPGHFR